MEGSQKVSLLMGMVGSIFFVGASVFPDMLGFDEDHVCAWTTSANGSDDLQNDTPRLSRFFFHSAALVLFPVLLYPLLPLCCVLCARYHARWYSVSTDAVFCGCLSGSCVRVLSVLLSTCMFAGLAIGMIMTGACLEVLMYTIFFSVELVVRPRPARHCRLSRRPPVICGGRERSISAASNSGEDSDGVYTSLPVAVEVGRPS